MTAKNHTPGPWEVLNSTSVFSALGADSGDGTQADHNDGWQICDCSVGATAVGGDYVELGFAVQKANAKLISAAPDLLSALMAARNDLAAIAHLAPGDYVQKSIASADAAIAKATQ